jgi:uncharacterized protein YhbP (UPF0306 family)
MDTRSLQEEQGLAEFLKQQKAAVLSVPIDEAGAIHVAALLFVMLERPMRFVFITNRHTEKCRLLLDGEVTAACAVGTEKGVPFALQMRGKASLLDGSAAEEAKDAYAIKFGRRHDVQAETSDEVVVQFTPTWARYVKYAATDYREGLERHYLKLA